MTDKVESEVTTFEHWKKLKKSKGTRLIWIKMNQQTFRELFKVLFDNWNDEIQTNNTIQWQQCNINNGKVEWQEKMFTPEKKINQKLGAITIQISKKKCINNMKLGKIFIMKKERRREKKITNFCLWEFNGEMWVSISDE